MALSQTQTALVLDGIGKPLKKAVVSIPTPKDDELLIKITAAGLNPMDQKCRDYDILHSNKVGANTVVAYDVAGEVVAKGPSAHQTVGTHVFAQADIHNPIGGALQEYTTVIAKWALPVPSNISDADASVFPINAISSAAAVFSPEFLGIPLPGSEGSKGFDYASAHLVIVGAGTNIGKLAIQYARIAGVSTIVAIASLSSTGILKKLGATHVVDRKADDVNAEVRKIIKDEDLLYVLDAYNHDLTLAVTLLSEAKKGKLTYLIPEAHQPAENIKRMKKAGHESKLVIGLPENHPTIAAPFYKLLGEWIENGQIQIPEYETIRGLDADKINAAMDAMKDGSNKMKYTIVF